jgi:glycosyltransferase involved in cell wall biosynthesis
MIQRQSYNAFRSEELTKQLELTTEQRQKIVQSIDNPAEDIATTTGIPRGRVDVIYNPVITPGLLRAASERPAHPWFEDDSRATVLGVGRLAPQKNFPLLIEAFARVQREHDARLVILGEGPERSNLEALVRRHGLERVARVL